MEDFYVYLPSNVKSIYFDNTSANFKTKLAQYCTLKDNYEVGLAEISYTYSFVNIYEDEKINIVYVGLEGSIEKQPVVLKRGYYKIEDLIASINNLIKLDFDYISLPKFELFNEKVGQKVKIIIGEHMTGAIFLEFSDNLAHVLGFDKEVVDGITNQILLSSIVELNANRLFKGIGNTMFAQLFSQLQTPDEIKANTTYDISCGFHTIFVYCDIIKSQIVGDTSAQLLRFVEIPNNLNYGDQVHLVFDKIQYLPLVTNQFESIEIDIKDDSGINIPFNHAKNVIVLHFRKRNNNRADEQSNNLFNNSNV